MIRYNSYFLPKGPDGMPNRICRDNDHPGTVIQGQSSRDTDDQYQSEYPPKSDNTVLEERRVVRGTMFTCWFRPTTTSSRHMASTVRQQSDTKDAESPMRTEECAPLFLTHAVTSRAPHATSSYLPFAVRSVSASPHRLLSLLLRISSSNRSSLSRAASSSTSSSSGGIL